MDPSFGIQLNSEPPFATILSCLGAVRLHEYIQTFQIPVMILGYHSLWIPCVNEFHDWIACHEKIYILLNLKSSTIFNCECVAFWDARNTDYITAHSTAALSDHFMWPGRRPLMFSVFLMWIDFHIFLYTWAVCCFSLWFLFYCL